jgi:hypothetical protein
MVTASLRLTAAASMMLKSTLATATVVLAG